ncbi:MAG TPA: ribosome maturation factor RimM [Clostridia bacterium]|nr:ribosome maturation factor RimM [Clostridia bacterium]
MLMVAKGIKAHGIRGDIKVNCFMDTPVSFSAIKELVALGKVYKVEKVRVQNEGILLKLEGVNTMNEAETFRGADFYCERDKLPPLKEDTYYISDLIGAEVIVGENKIGILSDILQYGSADIYVINGDKGTVMFPFVQGVTEKVELADKRIYLNKQKFKEVAVYED